MNQWQQMELDVAEKKILILLFGQTTIPEQTAKILNCFKINPNDYIKKFETKVEPILCDDGRVNGKLLASMMKVWKPELSDLIKLPKDNFRLVDVIEPIAEALFPKRCV